jgi:hypothetical protein
MEVLLHDIDLTPQGRLLALQALQKMFPKQMPSRAELAWRCREAEKFRKERLAKRRAHEDRLTDYKQAIEGKL